MQELKQKLSLVPEKPGCYLHKDKDGNIIYVGKAKNLKRRVNSYFNKIQTGKTKALALIGTLTAATMLYLTRAQAFKAGQIDQKYTDRAKAQEVAK